MQRIGYWFFLLLVGIFALIPFRLLYILSDGLAFLFYYVIKYRKTMIINNLKTTFPDKSEKEIKQICKDSYKNLSDILLEAIKGFSMKENTIKKRYTFTPDDKLTAYYEKGQHVIATAAHMVNWEWGANATGIILQHQILGVYKKVKQPYIDKFLIWSRSRFNVTLTEMQETASYLDAVKPEKPLMLVLIADQRPSNPYKAFWTTFLNRDTAFFYGAEKFAKEYNLPVFFFNMTRKKRGHYHVKIEWLCEDPSKTNKGDIVNEYARVLEREILKRPSDWLWSHSRWKHPKPEDLTQV